MNAGKVVRVAVNGYGVIGKRVADAVAAQDDMELSGVIDEAVPAPVLSAALYERFSSRDGADFANRVLSAMRKQFGGHDEKKKGKH